MRQDYVRVWEVVMDVYITVYTLMDNGNKHYRELLDPVWCLQRLRH